MVVSAPVSFCGGTITTHRGLLASLWSLVTALTGVAFVTALIFTLSNRDGYEIDRNYYDDNGDQAEGDREQEPEVGVTSRAMAFASLWTVILATLVSIFGTVILGWQSPTGQYYTCCSTQVHRTTPLALGSFIGSLLMFANLTFVCSILFGEFQVRDYLMEAEEHGNEGRREVSASASSMAFSIMCMFLTILYAGFAALTAAYSQYVLYELEEEERTETSLASSRSKSAVFVGGFDGYIADRFDIRPNSGTFVPPPPTDGMLA